MRAGCLRDASDPTGSCFFSHDALVPPHPLPPLPSYIIAGAVPQVLLLLPHRHHLLHLADVPLAPEAVAGALVDHRRRRPRGRRVLPPHLVLGHPPARSDAVRRGSQRRVQGLPGRHPRRPLLHHLRPVHRPSRLPRAASPLRHIQGRRRGRRLRHHRGGRSRGAVARVHRSARRVVGGACPPSHPPSSPPPPLFIHGAASCSLCACVVLRAAASAMHRRTTRCLPTRPSAGGASSTRRTSSKRGGTRSTTSAPSA